MLDAAVKALNQMFSRPFRSVLWRSIGYALILIVVSVPLAGRSSSKRVHIVVLGTTDQHGNLFPVDYYTDKPDNRGLAKISTLIKQVRKENKNVLLIDSGDTIQGTPLEYYHNKKNNAPADPMMLAMNALAYDAMTVGNHEYNFGLPVLEKADRKSTRLNSSHLPTSRMPSSA